MRLQSWNTSLLLHVGGVTLWLLLMPEESLTLRPTHEAVEVHLYRALLRQPTRHPERQPDRQPGGGSGHARPAARGFPPPPSRPAAHVPLLALEPSLPGVPDPLPLPLPAGLPLGVPGPPSSGPGTNGGIGDGTGGGVGPGAASGFSGAYSLASLSSAPVLIHKVEPEYTEEARRARLSGAVLLRVVINENGIPIHMEVLRHPGLGLAERAIESVSQWRFRPGVRAGKPVPVAATVEVTFSLL